MDTDPRLPNWDDWVPLGQHKDAPLPAAAFSDPVDHEDSPGPKAKVGTDTQGREVYYDPTFTGGRLPNGHLTVTGESGTGKTQALKNIIAELGLPTLVLDFKDDYSDPVYADREGFRVIDPTKMPLPVNPLAPPAASDGSVNPTFHSYQLGEIISRIYGLGDIQGFKLREAIKGVYQDAGIPMSAHVPDAQQQWPSFQAVKEKLAGGKDNTELLGHMSPIFDFGLFSGTETNLGGLGGVATTSSVIRLGMLPGNEVKNSVAEFLLIALYKNQIRQPQTAELRQILVLDEAWRLVQSPFLEPLMRESRAFGLGVFVGTQFPTDLPLSVSGNAGTKLFFGQTSPSQVSEVARIMTGKPYGTPLAEEVQTVVRGLKPLHALLVNKQYEPFVEVAADPYFARTEEPSMKALPGPGRSFNSSKDRSRLAQSDGVPEYICPHCQSPVANPGETCASCKALVKSNDGADSLAEVEQNFKEWTVTGAVEFPECRNCGKMKGFEPYPFARGFLECNHCKHLISPEDLAQDYNEMLLHHDMDLSTLPETSHPLGDANAAKEVNDCQFCGLEPAEREFGVEGNAIHVGLKCMDDVDNGKRAGTWAEKDPKTAELQNFPPGEDEEEGPFAPFSTSEWQMVKGPKRRASADGETIFCEGCEQNIDEDEWNQPCPVDRHHWRDPTPLGGTHRGINGCNHLHYYPNVTPSGCAYCSGTE